MNELLGTKAMQNNAGATLRTIISDDLDALVTGGQTEREAIRQINREVVAIASALTFTLKPLWKPIASEIARRVTTGMSVEKAVEKVRRELSNVGLELSVVLKEGKKPGEEKAEDAQ